MIGLAADLVKPQLQRWTVDTLLVGVPFTGSLPQDALRILPNEDWTETRGSAQIG